MNEARRFLRYVFPGLTFAIEVILLLSLSRFERVFQTAKELLPKQGLGVPLSLFIGSGGIGYLLSILHHFFLWTPWDRFQKIYPTIDHTGIIRRARKWKHVVVKKYGEGEPDDGRIGDQEEVNRRGAWRVFAAIWKSRLETSLRIKSADERSNSLTDMTHGSGAAFIGSIAAFLVWLFTDIRLSHRPLGLSLIWPLDIATRWPHYLAAVVAILISSALNSAYRQVLEHTIGFVELVLADELNDHYESYGPLDVFVFQRDLCPTPPATTTGATNNTTPNR